MRKLALLMASAVLIAFQAPGANATTFDWSYNGGGSIMGSGTFDAIDQGGGAFLVDAITGTANGQSITGLDGYAVSDQMIYTTSPYLDTNGVAFTVADGSAYNFYWWPTGTLLPSYDCGSATYCLIGPGVAGSDGGYDPTTGLATDTKVPIDFSLTETPLPAALPLFGSGVGALGLLGWRRKRKAQAAA